MKKDTIVAELKAHLPYSIFFTAGGIILAALLTYMSLLHMPHDGSAEEHQVQKQHHGEHDGQREEAEDHHDGEDGDHADHEHEDGQGVTSASGMLFHIFHPIHLLLSAMATTAMFFRHEKRIAKAVVVGVVGSLGVCGVSDIFMPFLCGGLLDGFDLHFHWCLIEHPLMVLPFTALGVVAGLLAAGTVHHSTVITHSAHTFISSTASLFYLISFGVTQWYVGTTLSLVFLIVILCVTIPCCLSDVVFPLLVAREAGDDCSCCHHQHGHE